MKNQTHKKKVEAHLEMRLKQLNDLYKKILDSHKYNQDAENVRALQEMIRENTLSPNR